MEYENEPIAAIMQWFESSLAELENKDIEIQRKKEAEWARAETMTDVQIEMEVARQVQRSITPPDTWRYKTPLPCTVRLLPHQLKGLGRLVEMIDDPDCPGGILADEMGLGKTLQILCMLLERPPTTEEPALIVVPSSLIPVWYDEIEKRIWGKDFLNVLFIHPKFKFAYAKDKVKPDFLRKHNVVVTSHKMFVLDAAESQRHKYTWRMLHDALEAKYLIVDEAHHAVNEETKIFQAIRDMRVEKKFLITGSPFRNTVSNICSMFKIMEVGVLAHEEVFKKAFTQQKKVNHYRVASRAQQQQLNTILSRFMIRRYKEDHLKDFPSLLKREETHANESQRDYAISVSVEKKTKKFCIPIESFGGKKATLTSRQLVCHPALALRDVEKPDEPLSEDTWNQILKHLRKGDNFNPGPRFLMASEKLREYREQKKPWTIIDGMDIKNTEYRRCQVCDFNRPAWSFPFPQPDNRCVFENPNNEPPGMQPHYIFCLKCREERTPCEDFEDNGTFHRFCKGCRDEFGDKLQVKIPKVLVYSPWRRALDLFDLYLRKHEGFPDDVIYRLDGSVDQDDRHRLIQEFQANQDPRAILLASIKCASEGLNVTKANMILFLNVTYCPGNEIQGISRAHRIKQEFPVVAVTLRAENCAEEAKLFARRKVKDEHAQGIVDAGRKPCHYVLREEDWDSESEDDEAENDDL